MRKKIGLVLLSALMLSACEGIEEKKKEQAVAPTPEATPEEMVNLNTFEAFALKEKDIVKRFFGNLDNYYLRTTADGVYPEAWENSILSQFTALAGIAPKKLDQEYSNEFDAGSVAGYLMGIYANSASSWEQNGSTYTRTYSCENAIENDKSVGNIIVTINNVSNASNLDVSKLQFEQDNLTNINLQNCKYGRLSANGSFSMEVLSVEGDVALSNSQSKIEVLTKYSDLTVTADGVYKANGDKKIVVDNLNNYFSYGIDYINYYTYSNESGVEFSETVNGNESFLVNGSLYNISINKTGAVSDNGRLYQHNLKTGHPFVGETIFPENQRWTIDSPYQGSLSIDLDGHNISLTTLSKGSILVKLDNSDKESKYIRW